MWEDLLVKTKPRGSSRHPESSSALEAFATKADGESRKQCSHIQCLVLAGTRLGVDFSTSLELGYSKLHFKRIDGGTNNALNSLLCLGLPAAHNSIMLCSAKKGVFKENRAASPHRCPPHPRPHPSLPCEGLPCYLPGRGGIVL